MSTSAERMRRMRARRAAGLLPPEDGPVLRDADDLLAPTMETTLAALGLADTDAAVAQLARRYAQAMDDARDPAWAARWLGPELQRCLEALGATPMARARLRKPDTPRGTPRLDALRQARMERRPPL